MQRVINTTERNIRLKPFPCKVIPANASTDVLDEITDIIKGEKTEVAGRYIQNIGANPCFYSFGEDADNGMTVQGQMQAGQQLNCSNHGMRVAVFSPLGTTIAITFLRRVDLSTHENILPAVRP